MVTEPPSVTHEVVRSRVLQLLDRRWEHIVTTVTAGPGFGKSIAVGQAMRANQAVPRGVEAWVSCRSGCEEPGRLVASVCNAFDAPTERRGMLEPDRPAGQPPYFVRADGEHVRLAAVAGLTVDLWEVEQSLVLADTAQRDGDTAARLQHLEVVVERWRGRPLPDLDRVPPLSAVGRHMIAGLADACLTFGELELVRGSLSQVLRCAEQALAADPYLERAHRLAIAVHRQARDRSATRAAVEDLHAMLHDLGVEPDETTQMLLRGTDAWLGPRQDTPDA